MEGSPRRRPQSETLGTEEASHLESHREGRNRGHSVWRLQGWKEAQAAGAGVIMGRLSRATITSKDLM